MKAFVLIITLFLATNLQAQKYDNIKNIKQIKRTKFDQSDFQSQQDYQGNQYWEYRSSGKIVIKGHFDENGKADGTWIFYINRSRFDLIRVQYKNGKFIRGEGENLSF